MAHRDTLAVLVHQCRIKNAGNDGMVHTQIFVIQLLLEFGYLCICFKSSSEKRAVKDSNTIVL